MSEKIIIELERSEIELIAALAHYWNAHEEDPVAQMIISDLVEQTDYVYSDPEQHGIGTSLILSTSLGFSSAYRWGAQVSELDLSNLSPMIYDIGSWADDT